jgi:hypothetical protein
LDFGHLYLNKARWLGKILARKTKTRRKLKNTENNIRFFYMDGTGFDGKTLDRELTPHS